MILVAAGYTIAFFFLSFALGAGIPVGVAYGIWTAAGIALVAVLARAIWNDALTKRMVYGIVFIIAGVILVEFGSSH